MSKNSKVLQQTEQKMAAALKQSRIYANGQERRTPTHSEVVAAAWGNVAAEDPQVKLRDAQRAIRK